MNWNAAKDEFSIFVEDATGKIIADVRSNSMTMGEHFKRACLLAAAPEMLAILKRLASREYADGPKVRTREIDELIARAEGR